MLVAGEDRFKALRTDSCPYESGELLKQDEMYMGSDNDDERYAIERDIQLDKPTSELLA